MDRKKLLAAVYCLAIEGRRPTVAAVGGRVGADVDATRRALEELARQGSLKLEKGEVKLTPRGRRRLKVVFIGGGFEVLHKGHVYTIERARALGDVLVVSVARDSTIRRRKNREPFANEQERVELLSSMRQVDAAILGVEGDIYETLARVGPDVVALGYDQYHSEADITREAARRGMKLKVVRLDSPYPEIKTSSLLRET
jgi:FAD synthetase